MSHEAIGEQGDARALQLRLYRELGVAAVAIALEPMTAFTLEAPPALHAPATVATDKPQHLAA